MTILFIFIVTFLVLIDSFENTIDLLLKKKLKFFNHEFINWTSLTEISDQSFNSVTLVDDDALEAIVCDININIELRISVIIRLLLIRDFFIV
mmetsp:Transcript_21060/g.29095  ORF Transcript_21060/g.29095 Transcript_21060/m.29095 type:complete len:93 (-) Transcript_21060:31-309(-)